MACVHDTPYSQGEAESQLANRNRSGGDCDDCCEHCNTWTIDCPDCCRCLPRRFCVKFEPDDPDECECPDVARADWTTGHVYGPVELECLYDTLTVTISLVRVSNVCYWQVAVDDGGYDLLIDDLVAITDAGCANPRFTYAITFGGCDGTLVIERDDQFIMPIEQTDEGCWVEACEGSNCRCLCKALCAEHCAQEVTLLFDESREGFPYVWGPGTLECVAGDQEVSVELRRDSYTMECYLVVILDGAQSDPIDLPDTCGANLNISEVNFPSDPYVELTVRCALCESCERPPVCDDRCVNNGDIHVECGAGEFANFYEVAPIGDLVGTGECCSFEVILEKITGQCLWTESGAAYGSCWEFDPAAQTLTGASGGTTLVYVPVDAYDPLCTAEFDLDFDASTIAGDCGYYERICIGPENSCCDSSELRTESMPETLFVDGQHCCGGGVTDFSFTISWDASISAWTGSVDICNATLEVTLSCVCGLSAGCDPACYSMVTTMDGCGANSGATGGNCSCEPFEATFDLGNVFTNCCAAEDLIDLVLVVTE